jgi:hypothetical protein
MARGKTDISKMLAKHRRLAAAGPEARRAALREMLKPVLAEVEAKAPRDTNRYVRAYMQARLGLGIPGVIPGVEKSEFLETVVWRLRRQLGLWEARMEYMRREGRTDEKYYRKVVRNVERLREMGAKYTDSSIVIFGRGEQIHRTISTIYGGEGRFVDLGNRTFAQLINREPHARIVESRHFAMRQLLYRQGKNVGLARAKAAHLRELKAQEKVGG